MAPPWVRLIVCGTADRGDDGAALLAVAHLLPALPPEISVVLEVRRSSQLDPSDIIDVPDGTTCLIVDTVTGVLPGSIVTMALADLAARPVVIAPRSSHALPVDQVILLAETIRGSLPPGSFVGIGGKWFGYGTRFSRAVRAGMPELQSAISAELGRMLLARTAAAETQARAKRPCRSGRSSLPARTPEPHDCDMTSRASLRPPFPGIPAIVDGSEAVAHVEARLAEVACVYPITPSTTMAAVYQAAVADGRTDLWGTHLRFIEPESEHSSASAAEGAALAGARVTNFTAGQGLVLMKEVLFVISGKRLPIVFHVGARALTSQALNIHAGHDDVMAVADCGWGILFARNAQEAADLAAIARRAAEATETPFIVAQDGFLTTHTLENVLLPEDELLRAFVGDPRLHIRDLFDPAESLMTGVVQNQDSYMKGRIGQRAYTDRIPATLAESMDEWARLTGRAYGAIEAYRTEGAQEIVVAMGTIADTTLAVVDHLRAKGRPVGCVAITSFRPFPSAAIVAALHGARAVAVIERTDEPLAQSNPLTREIRSALYDAAAEGAMVPRVLSIAAGLGSRDVAAGDLVAVFDQLARHDEQPQRFFVIGIKHPLALVSTAVDLRPKGAYSLRGHSIGGFGSVTTNKLVATLAGELFDKRVQAYPRYGSEKKGLPTTYYLTIADAPIRVHAELDHVDFVPLHDVSAFGLGDPLDGLVEEGDLFIQSPLADPEAIWLSIPAHARAEILARRIRVTALDTAAIALRHAPRPEFQVRMQGVALVGVFLRVSPFAIRAGLDRNPLLAAVHARLGRFFGKRGGAVVEANLAVITEAYDNLIDVTAAIQVRAAASPALEGALP